METEAKPQATKKRKSVKKKKSQSHNHGNLKMSTIVVLNNDLSPDHPSHSIYDNGV